MAPSWAWHCLRPRHSRAAPPIVIPAKAGTQSEVAARCDRLSGSPPARGRRTRPDASITTEDQPPSAGGLILA